MQPRKPPSKRKAAALVHVAAVLLLSLGLSVLLLSRVQGAEGEAGTGAPQPCSIVCWFLVIAGIAGTALASFGGRFGWLLLFGLQPLWVAYALATGQGGLILGSVAYGVVQLNGFLRAAGKGNRFMQERCGRHGGGNTRERDISRPGTFPPAT